VAFGFAEPPWRLRLRRKPRVAFGAVRQAAPKPPVGVRERMTTSFDVHEVLTRYDPQALTLCSIGSHSALEVAAGARAHNLRNLVITEAGRELTYADHYIRRSDPPRGCVDAVLALAKFSDILDPGVQQRLLAQNVLFIANRSFEVYLRQRYTYGEIEQGMRVPFFGSRTLLRAEERDEADNQYALLERAQVRYPKQFAHARDIDRLVIVKAPHAKVSFERAFFLARSHDDYDRQCERLMANGMVNEAGLCGAVIEEFALGPSVNLNFFFSPILDEIELMGTDTRRQTNLEGLKNLPFAQARALADEPVRLEEAGHIAATLTESMLEKAFAMGERFVRATQADGNRGIIGPFALQCVIVAGPPKDFIVYDVSLRIPGSPGTRFTPYSAYRWGRDVSVGERIAMEVVWARDADRLADILT
jgi:5-formaminoimidazole-4-carboxamide-1-(beta)-D-ribofuranosyl 5'-monophosphate synthetase